MAASTLSLAGLLLLAGMNAASAAVPTRDELAAADYGAGKRAFEQRCSACHTLAQGGANLSGPNLWHVSGRRAGTQADFGYSDALRSRDLTWDAGTLLEFMAGPTVLVPGTRMVIPEPVPEADRTALLAFLLLETGGADWPRPAAARSAEPAEDRSRPLPERFPGFWNHLMTNTTRYRMETPAGEVRFDAYFNKDGTVTASEKSINGFWQVDGRDFFCYVLTGIPATPSRFIECFPVRAMSIPRFAPELWQSSPAPGVTLHGGIVPGRP